MRALSTKDVSQANALSRAIVEASTLDALFAELANSLVVMLGADALVLALNGPYPTLAPERILSFGLDDGYAAEHAALLSDDPGRLRLANAWRKKLSLVLTAADLPGTPRQLEQNVVVDRLWRPRGLFHPLAIVLTLDNKRQCILSFRRKLGKQDFGDRERAISKMLMPFLAASLNQLLLREQAADLGRILERVAGDPVNQAGLIAFDSTLQLVHADASVNAIAAKLSQDAEFLHETRLKLTSGKQDAHMIVLQDDEGRQRRLVFEVAEDARGKPALVLRVDPNNASITSEDRLTAFGLTPREIQVALAVLDGMDNSQISEKFGITRTTVAKHLQQVMGKLSVRSRTQIGAKLGELVCLDRISGIDRITKRERLAIETLAQGMTSDEAAKSLNISRGTYANQLRSAAKKLEVSGRRGLLPLLRQISSGTEGRTESKSESGKKRQILNTSISIGPTQLMQSLTEAVRPHGFHATIFHTLLKTPDAELPIKPGWGVQDHNSPDFTNWRESYVQNHAYLGDPVFHASMDAVGPLISAWDLSNGRIFGDVERKLLPSEIVLARDVTQVTGALSGVAVPLNNARGETGLIIFLSEAGGPGAAQQHRRVLATLTEISTSFHSAMRPKIPEKEVHQLGDQELACLELLARGMSLDEIASALSISRRTVANLLANADRKFGSMSRYQTLSRAVAAGIVKPWP
jgi:DNA-binding CsgD family transcriptional regulator